MFNRNQRAARSQDDRPHIYFDVAWKRVVLKAVSRRQYPGVRNNRAAAEQSRRRVFIPGLYQRDLIWNSSYGRWPPIGNLWRQSLLNRVLDLTSRSCRDKKGRILLCFAQLRYRCNCICFGLFLDEFDSLGVQNRRPILKRCNLLQILRPSGKRLLESGNLGGRLLGRCRRNSLSWFMCRHRSRCAQAQGIS